MSAVDLLVCLRYWDFFYWYKGSNVVIDATVIAIREEIVRLHKLGVEDIYIAPR